MFSEPKLVIPGTSAVEPAEGSESVETKPPSGEQLPEAKPAAVAQAVSAAPVQLDGRQTKRARNVVELVDSNTVGGARKKRKGNKKSG